MNDVFGNKWCLNFAESGHEVRVFGNISSTTSLPVVYMHTIADEGSDIWQRCLEMALPAFVLVEVAVPQWNDDLSPWPGPALTKRGQPFGGGADDYLEVLVAKIMPRVERMLASPPKYNALVGYSLAGLFALYSLYRTPLFARIASVSGSLWYWDFVQFVSEQKALGAPRYIYLSLGDKEGQTADEVLSTVEPYTGRVFVRLSNRGHHVVFERTEGNHFHEPEARMARGIANVLRAEDPIV